MQVRIPHNVNELQRAAEHAARRYRRYPNVVGVAAGTKYVSGVALDRLCVQFFVTRKLSDISTPLPAYVFARGPRGRVDRTRRLPTDVIEVGRPRLACTAGSTIEGIGNRGTITLLFRNRDRDKAGSFYLLTCAHLAGDLTESPPVQRELTSPTHARIGSFAEFVKSSTRSGKTIEYDVALAELTRCAVATLGAAAIERLEGRVADSDTRLTGFLPAQEIRPSLAVDCRCAESGGRSGRVCSLPGSVLVRINSRDVWARNACLIDVPVQAGDSGGIVYKDDSAAGIIFARSPHGWGWFHPLESAVAFLELIEPRFALSCFSWNERQVRRRK
jgi:hypothetical protein